MNVTQKLIKSHLVSGEMTPGSEIGITIDHILQQDATGTLIMLELEAMGLTRTKAELAVQYVDHNLLQTDFKNADDHAFLQSAARKFGYWFSRSGNGISHVVHMERFGKPGKTLLGSDSHTPAGGGIGMLAMGTGGLDVALASAGEPYYVKMPKVFGVKLIGKLNDWVSAKDVVLEMLRRYDVNGGRDYVIEYYGEGLKNLSAWDRHVIANMGTELGATSTVFPSDEITKQFFKQEGREEDWIELKADSEKEYDKYDTIDLAEVEPLIALPTSPGNVVTVREVAGQKISQVVVGSSANPGLRDFSIVAQIVKGRTVADNVSFDVNPSSRQKYENLVKSGDLLDLLDAGARTHQTGCMGCIGMGQAPASGEISLRTMPRNFPGRSGTKDDKVYLCSPETAAAGALTGEITDPRDLEDLFNIKYPKWIEPEIVSVNKKLLMSPEEGDTSHIELRKGPNIKTLPEFDELENELEVPILLKMGDNISTDEILKGGADVLPLRSNIEKISEYSYFVIDEGFHKRALTAYNEYGGHIVIAGENYAQGSSREHAAIAPKYLGQKASIAKSYARIGRQNLINFGILPLIFVNNSDYLDLAQDDILIINELRNAVINGKNIFAKLKAKNKTIELTYQLSERQKEIILRGGLINVMKLRS